MRVALTGASGFLGQRLARELLEQGDEVLALVRDPSALALPGAQVARLDLGRGVPSLAGIEALVHAAATTSEWADPRLFDRVNVQGVEQLIEACRRDGVRRVLFVSSQSAARGRLGLYGGSKKRGEELWLSSGLDVTILRPTVIYGPGRRGIFARLVHLVRRWPVVPVVGSSFTQPVYVDDVTAALRAALANPATSGRTYDLAGADRLPFIDWVRLLQRELGLCKPIVRVPVWAAWLLARLTARLARPPLTVDNVLGLTQDTAIDLEPARRDLGFVPRSLREGCKRALASA